jgi:hypothetical protein
MMLQEIDCRISAVLLGLAIQFSKSEQHLRCRLHFSSAPLLPDASAARSTYLTQPVFVSSFLFLKRFEHLCSTRGLFSLSAADFAAGSGFYICALKLVKAFVSFGFRRFLASWWAYRERETSSAVFCW